jgi:hypothetical protein
LARNGPRTKNKKPPRRLKARAVESYAIERIWLIRNGAPGGIGTPDVQRRHAFYGLRGLIGRPGRDSPSRRSGVTYGEHAGRGTAGEDVGHDGQDLLILGEFALRMGQPAKVRVYLSEADESAKRMGMCRVVAQSYFNLAELGRQLEAG